MGKDWQWSRSFSKGEREMNPPGCMGGMLHYLDFHHLLFSSTCNSRPPSSPKAVLPANLNTPQGIEAPRNSLELEEGKPSSSSPVVESFDIPVGIQVRPVYDSLASKSKKNSSMVSCLEDEERRVPQTPDTPRTPSLVARLMGVDGLPEPIPSPAATTGQKALKVLKDGSKRKEKDRELEKKNTKHDPRKGATTIRKPLRSINCNVKVADTGSRSLPDTPRVSSARSSGDFDPRRLSLQINRERETSSRFHGMVGGDYSLPPSPTHYVGSRSRRRYQDENISPRGRDYAKEIVKQVKEIVSNRRSAEGCEDSIPMSKRTIRGSQKKAGNADTKDRDIPLNEPVSANPPPPPPSVPISPPTKTVEPLKVKLEDHIPNLRSLLKPTQSKQLQPSPPLPQLSEAKATPSKCKKGSNERFTVRFKKPWSPPSSPLATTNGEKKSPSISSNPLPKTLKSTQQPAIRFQEQALLKKDGDVQMHIQTKSSPERTHHQHRRPPSEQDPEYNYVKSVLQWGGFLASTGQFVRRYSPSLPVDPIVFHQLELELPMEDRKCSDHPLRYRWNRKLLFHLVEEMLGDLLLGPTTTDTSSIYQDRCCGNKSNNGGPSLLRKLWMQIQNISSADCQYLADIDAMVAADLRTGNIRRLLRHPAVADEADDVAAEVEQEILDGLLGETAASLSLSSLSLSLPENKKQGADGDVSLTSPNLNGNGGRSNPWYQ